MGAEHKPTPATRKKVREGYGKGLSKELVAASIGIHRNTLEKHYSEDLESSRAEKVGTLVNWAWERAQTSDQVLLFMLRCVGQFAEVQKVESKVEAKVELPPAVRIRITGEDES